MARRKYYVGSVGPFLYDDEELIDDQDGDFAGESRVGFRTDGSVRASISDDTPDGLVRREDIEGSESGLQDQIDVLESDIEDLDTYAKSHGAEHLPGGDDPISTKIVTVVTAVDFVAESVTTEDITVIDN